MLLGNQKIQKYFDNLIKSDGLNHAYLFYGPEGVGKKSLVLRISEVLAGPAASNPDLRVIDKGNEEIYIADIRELKNFIYLTPFGKYKIVIINNAHNLGRDGSNALLKILEEPPGKSILFLVSHLPKMLLPTIISRCQPMRFGPIKKGEISGHLINEHKIKKDVADICAELSRGSLGRAMELADNFNNFQKNISLLNKLMKADFKERFDMAKKISTGPEDLKKIVGDWFIHSASSPNKRLARGLLHLNNIISKSQFNHKLFLENFLIRL